MTQNLLTPYVDAPSHFNAMQSQVFSIFCHQHYVHSWVHSISVETKDSGFWFHILLVETICILLKFQYFSKYTYVMYALKNNIRFDMVVWQLKVSISSLKKFRLDFQIFDGKQFNNWSPGPVLTKNDSIRPRSRYKLYVSIKVCWKIQNFIPQFLKSQKFKWF